MSFKISYKNCCSTDETVSAFIIVNISNNSFQSTIFFKKNSWKNKLASIRTRILYRAICRNPASQQLIVCFFFFFSFFWSNIIQGLLVVWNYKSRILSLENANGAFAFIISYNSFQDTTSEKIHIWMICISYIFFVCEFKFIYEHFP